MVNRIVTGAHYGLRDWLVQRVTAVVMAVYTLVVAVYLLLQPSFGYDTWIELFSGNVMRSFLDAVPAEPVLSRLDRRARHRDGLCEAGEHSVC